jgi:hypothetical protein
VEAPVEPSGSALFSATATMTAIDRLNIKKTMSDGNCVSFTLGNPAVSFARPLRLTLPTGWALTPVVATGACNGTGSGQVIGAQGSVTLDPSGTTCTITAHLTLFHATETTGTLTTTRFDADNVPISGGLSSAYCP